MDVPVHNRKWPWLLLALMATVSGMVLVAARRRQRQFPLRAGAVSVPAVPDAAAQPVKSPAALPASPLAAKPFRWLLFISAGIGLALLLSVLERPYALAGLGVVVAGAGLSAIDRAGWLHPLVVRGQRGLETRRARWLAFVAVIMLLVVAGLALPQPYSTLALAALLAVWGVVMAQRTLRWASTLSLEPALQRPLIRRLLFGVAAALLGAIIFTLEAPYGQITLLSLCAGAIPAAIAQRRKAGRRAELVGVMRGAALVAVLLAAAAANIFLTVPLYEFQDALRLLVIGAGALALAGHLSARTQAGAALMEPVRQALARARLTRRDRWLAGLGVVLLALVAEANGRVLKIPALVHMSVHVQFGLIVISTALLAAGLGGARWPARWQRIDWRTVGLLLLLTGTALVLRFWQLEDGLRLFVDELNFASVVRRFWDTPNVPLLEPMSSIAAFPFIFPYWQAHTIELFGRNLVGLRAASAITGALTVPAVYLLGRATFDRATGLLAALLLVAFPPHLHFSRLGMNNIADPLFGTLALALIARGLAQNRRFDFVLGGALLGLTHYFYEGGRFLFMAVIVAWLLGLVYLWRLRWRDLLVVALAAVIVALPIYYTLVAIDRPVAARMVNNQAALAPEYWQGLLAGDIDLGGHVRTRVIYPLLLYVRESEGSLFYKGEHALILPALVPLFLLGLGYALARLRRPGPLLLILWVLATSMGNSLMVAADHSPRYVVAFPALMLLAAVGARYTWGLLWPGAGWRRLKILLLALLVGGLAVYQADYYFNHHLPLYRDQIRRSWPHRDGQDAVFRSLSFPPGTRIHLISAVPPDEGYTNGVLKFFRDDLELESVEPGAVTRHWIAQLEPGVDHAFYVEPGHEAAVELLDTYFYLLPVQFSPYDDIKVYHQFPLYYAPYLVGYSERRLARLNDVPFQQHFLPVR
jgi:hypothetical protein